MVLDRFSQQFVESVRSDGQPVEITWQVKRKVSSFACCSSARPTDMKVNCQVKFRPVAFVL